MLVKPGASAICQYPWPKLNAAAHGFRKGEMVTLAAGSGAGKSSICREWIVHFLRAGLKVGVFMLEESVQRSLQGIVGVDINMPITWTRSLSAIKVRTAFDELMSTGNLFSTTTSGAWTPTAGRADQIPGDVRRCRRCCCRPPHHCRQRHC